ncbi:MAG: hypothetical protein QM621_08115 [Aeromicrobium sp.]|uniref:hypothetical protein n=1 Tax=Aeromicrobium sp. TaxID=1871063 RepID=UPI0039E6E195
MIDATQIRRMWEAISPEAVEALEDPEGFFRGLAETAGEQMVSLYDQLDSDPTFMPCDPEDFMARVARGRQAQWTARETALAEVPLPSPPPVDPEAEETAEAAASLRRSLEDWATRKHFDLWALVVEAREDAGVRSREELDADPAVEELEAVLDPYLMANLITETRWCSILRLPESLLRDLVIHGPRQAELLPSPDDPMLLEAVRREIEWERRLNEIDDPAERLILERKMFADR